MRSYPLLLLLEMYNDSTVLLPHPQHKGNTNGVNQADQIPEEPSDPGWSTGRPWRSIQEPMRGAANNSGQMRS